MDRPRWKTRIRGNDEVEDWSCWEGEAPAEPSTPAREGEARAEPSTLNFEPTAMVAEDRKPAILPLLWAES